MYSYQRIATNFMVICPGDQMTDVYSFIIVFLCDYSDCMRSPTIMILGFLVWRLPHF